MRFRAEQHLRRQLDFQHVRTHGRRSDCGAFMLWYSRQSALAQLSPVPPKSGESSEHVVAETAAPPAPVKAPASVTCKPTPARLGVVASRSAVGNSPQRARAKRRLREVFRAHQELVPPGYDLLLVARSSLNRLEYCEVERRFVEACRKIFPSASA
ncbi:MAG: ribonuclease P protein component [Opitutus sp.]|nr:ribonuclease P protein component [Opitutus sp.]MCS6246971.1 ribonuclease P protein component [Opitutus sp.]MCS6272771.1 ribonuclease P protein component [Opitutus sp.]MCS6276403.1 ribonuclease P protein component [Opitutus sp.]MCS6301949.1 ribonuclease P protein component [Opitutus sp.]